MALFKKKSPDVIDLTKLKKQGILERSQEIAKKEDSSSDFIDLSKTESSAGDPFSMLDSLANTASSSSVSGSSELGGKELSQVKVKLEDLEYKLDRFVERLEKIESKLDL